jgi:hypothetical protein
VVTVKVVKVVVVDVDVEDAAVVIKVTRTNGSQSPSLVV